MSDNVRFSYLKSQTIQNSVKILSTSPRALSLGVISEQTTETSHFWTATTVALIM